MTMTATLPRLQKLSELLAQIDAAPVIEIGQTILRTASRAGTVYVVGDGGSASLASHVATDFAKLTHAGIAPPVVSLVENSALLTMIGNDYGFESIFSYQLENVVRPPDALLAISGSGHSRNVVRAVEVARQRGLDVMALLGFAGGALKSLVHTSVVVPSSDYGLIEDLHHMLLHTLVEQIRAESPNETRVVVLDRDGVLLESPPIGSYILGPEHYRWLPGAREGVRTLKAAGFVVVVATNQRGVSLGLMNGSDVSAIHAKMQRELGEIGTSIDRFYVCTHGLDEGCSCRKPRTGLLDAACSDFGVSARQSVVIGDSAVDLAMAERSGARAILVGPNAIDGAQWSPTLSDAAFLLVSRVVTGFSTRPA